MRILLVEDEVAIANFIAEGLEEEGFSVDRAHNGKDKGKVCRRTRIIEKIWDIHFDHDTSVIDVYINFLRKKLDTPGQPSFIQTIRGVGYRVNDDA